MASNIDATQPPALNPTTAGMRANMAAAKSEIEALQILAARGVNTITVGSSGMFATIASAIAAVAVSEMFVPLAGTADFPVSATTWDLNDDIVYLTNFNFVAGYPAFYDVWFKLAGDSRCYPMRSVSAATPDSLMSKINRIDATVSGTFALSFYRATPINILLLDSVHEETLNITSPVCLNINSVHRTAWRGLGASQDQAISVDGATCTYSKITIGNNIQMVAGVSGSTTSACELIFDCTHHRNDSSDLHDLGFAGCIKLISPLIELNNVTGLGHSFLTYGMPGNLEIDDAMIKISCNRSGPTSVKCLPFDSLTVKALVVNGMSVVIDDIEQRLGQLSLFSMSEAGNFHVSGVTIKSLYPCAATVVILDEMPSITPNISADTSPVNITNCHIEAANFSGTKKIYRASTGGSGRVVNFQCCSGGLIDTPSVGSRTGNALIV